MPRVDTWACRVCGKLKGATNAWWLVSRINGQLVIRPMTERVLPEEDAVCGREHVQREVELWMAETAGGAKS